MTRSALILFLVAGAASWMSVAADTIVHRGREYSGVVIEELSTQYVVHFPETGRKKYFQKEEVSSVEFNREKVRPSRRGVDVGFPTRERGTSKQEPENSALLEQQSALEQYKQRTKIRAQAEFDAAFEHWAQLEDEYREALLADIDAQAAAAEAERRQTAQAIASQREQFEQEMETRRQDIQEAASERDAQISEAYDIAFEAPPVAPYGFLSEREAREAEVLDSIFGVPYEEPVERLGVGFPEGYREPPPLYYEAPGPGFPDRLDQADAEAYWIEQEYSAEIAAENRALRQLSKQARRFERRSTLRLRQSRDRVQRLAGLAEYLRGIEGALANEYEPALDYINLFSMEARGVTQRPVQAASSLLRIDWWVAPSDPWAQQLTIRVYDSASDRLVKADSSAKLPFEHFLIIDRPGDYLIEVEAPPQLTYTIEAKEPRYVEYAPIAPAE
ncbi:MAG: hypothetical protein U9Q79_11740, partial [Candidatus Hydrogenedentes bacterium]|nr:hypothetical protein [Candidatus Hydrogenedentota bacterium]